MKKISFVLPVYNVEKYLPRCLDSIYSQGVPEDVFEVVACVDGSPDQSLNFLRNYSLGHSNLILIDKENGGVSSARNVAMDSCSGEYILFVDPDDFLIDDSLAKIIEYIGQTTYNSDICYLRSFEEGKELFAWTGLFKSGEKCNYEALLERTYGHGAVWGTLYRRGFLENNGIKFPLGIKQGEDGIFSVISIMLAQEISFADIKFYSLSRRPDSASVIKKDTTYNLKSTLDYIRGMYSDKRFGGKRQLVLYGQCYSSLSMALNSASLCRDIKYSELVSIIRFKDYLPISRDCLPARKYKIILLNCSPFLFYLMCKIRNIMVGGSKYM